jgi:hypothetical protein
VPATEGGFLCLVPTADHEPDTALNFPQPRPKQTVGRRLALAAKAIAYGEKGTVYTGPVIKSCAVHPEGQKCTPDDTGNASNTQVKCGDGRGDVYRQITVNYREDLMGTDAVKLWANKDSMLSLATVTLYNCLNTTCISSCGRNVICVDRCKVLTTTGGGYNICQQGAAPVIGPSGNGYNGQPERSASSQSHSSTPLSPLEVQYNHTFWMPAAINTGFGHQGEGAMLNTNCHDRNCPGPHCSPACVNYTRMVGWNSMTADVPTALPLGCHHRCPYPAVSHFVYNPSQYCYARVLSFVLRKFMRMTGGCIRNVTEPTRGMHELHGNLGDHRPPLRLVRSALLRWCGRPLWDPVPGQQLPDLALQCQPACRSATPLLIIIIVEPSSTTRIITAYL